jgi:gamma-glutamylaminecyclotransferase
MTLGNVLKPVTYAHYNEGHDIWRNTDNLKSEMVEVVERGMYTPDYPKLAELSHHYIFVYGTLKRGFRNHKFLRGEDLVGCGFTDQDRFFMAKEKQAKFPIALFDNREEYRARLYGEIYKVLPETILDLDNLESNGTVFKRFPLLINYWQKIGGPYTLRCWVYVGVREYWSTRVDRLSALRLAKPNNGDTPYWIFAKDDES